MVPNRAKIYDYHCKYHWRGIRSSIQETLSDGIIPDGSTEGDPMKPAIARSTREGSAVLSVQINMVDPMKPVIASGTEEGSARLCPQPRKPGFTSLKMVWDLPGSDSGGPALQLLG